MKIASTVLCLFITFCSFAQSSKNRKTKNKNSINHEKVEDLVVVDSVALKESVFFKMKDTVSIQPNLTIPEIKLSEDLAVYSKVTEKKKKRKKKRRGDNRSFEMLQQQKQNWHQQQIMNHHEQMQQNRMQIP